MQPEPAAVVPFAPRAGHQRAPGPVFVAGPDRSGTTLMFALLSSHPDLCMVRRTNMFRYFYGRYGDLARPENLDRCLSDMTRYRRMRHLQPDAERIRREFLEGPPTYGRLFALFHAHHAQRAGRPRWGDKSLHTEHHADDVFAAFPDARIVHMVRDPRDRYASVRRRNGRDLSRVGAATARWLMSTRAGRRNALRHHDRYLVVRYEDLVRAPETTVRRVCDHIGVAYSPEMLTMDGLPGHRDTGGNSSFGDLEPGAISVRAVGRFRTVLSPGELSFIDLFAGRAAAGFGYERVPGQFTTSQRVRFVVSELPVATARMFGWMLLTRTQLWRGERIPRVRLEPEPVAVGAS
jgi:hypothetical protein